MTYIDATIITDPADADEVLALWLYYAEDADEIAIHSRWCHTQICSRNECTCVPRTMRIGAKA